MAQLLVWGIEIGMVIVLLAVWLRLYPSGHKWPVWLLTVVIASVGFALIGGVIYNFDQGSVAAFAVAGIVAGVSGLIYAEWSSVKHLLSSVKRLFR